MKFLSKQFSKIFKTLQVKKRVKNKKIFKKLIMNTIKKPLLLKKPVQKI